MSIRDLRPTDYEALRDAYWLCYDERDAGYSIGILLFREKPSEADEARWFAQVLKRVETQQEMVLIAEIDGRAVGSCSLTQCGPGPRSECSHMGDLGILVHRDYRAHGLGSQLLGEAIRRARTRYELVRLWVHSDNPNAKRLYERYGFVTCGLLPAAVKRGERYIDLEMMVLDLRNRPP
ncbi:MAG TPA: GNAT family N-acetyltransferase [Thermoplasmata archaeon]|nr:GNAT family N-acetyltransferase [Thermoplasmata archaeon]